MNRTMVCTANVKVPLEEGHVSISRGDKVDTKKLPTSSAEQMARLGQLVTESDWKDQQEASPEKPVKAKDDWRDAPASALELSDAIKEAIAKAGLETIRHVLVFAETNEGDLTKIKGVDAEAAKAMQESLLAAKPA